MRSDGQFALTVLEEILEDKWYNGKLERQRTEYMKLWLAGEQRRQRVETDVRLNRINSFFTIKS